MTSLDEALEKRTSFFLSPEVYGLGKYGDEQTLSLFLDEIDDSDLITRYFIEELRKRLRELERDKYGKHATTGEEIRHEESVGSRTAMLMDLESVKIKIAIGYCGNVLSGVRTLWDRTSALVWAVYDVVDLDERSVKLTSLAEYLREEDELKPFFDTSFINFNESGGAYFLHGSVMDTLGSSRNRVIHSIRAASKTATLELFNKREPAYVTYFDTHTGKERRVEVFSLDKWVEISAESYSHWVKSYNLLVDILKKKAGN